MASEAKAFAHRGDHLAGHRGGTRVWLQCDGRDGPAQRNRVSGASAPRARWADPFAVGITDGCRCRPAARPEILQNHAFRQAYTRGFAEALSTSGSIVSGPRRGKGVMPRALHIAILRNAALLVPAPERERNGWPNGGRNFGTLNTTPRLFASALFAMHCGSGSRALAYGVRLVWIHRCDARFSLSVCQLLTDPAPYLLADCGCRHGRRRGQGSSLLGLLWMYLLSLLVLLTLNPLDTWRVSAQIAMRRRS